MDDTDRLEPQASMTTSQKPLTFDLTSMQVHHLCGAKFTTIPYNVRFTDDGIPVAADRPCHKTDLLARVSKQLAVCDPLNGTRNAEGDGDDVQAHASSMACVSGTAVSFRRASSRLHRAAAAGVQLGLRGDRARPHQHRHARYQCDLLGHAA
ncbi:MAG: hypothetical protein ACJ8AW_36920 [Rhodopila sp.]